MVRNVLSTAYLIDHNGSLLELRHRERHFDRKSVLLGGSFNYIICKENIIILQAMLLSSHHQIYYELIFGSSMQFSNLPIFYFFKILLTSQSDPFCHILLISPPQPFLKPFYTYYRTLKQCFPKHKKYSAPIIFISIIHYKGFYPMQTQS